MKYLIALVAVFMLSGCGENVQDIINTLADDNITTEQNTTAPVEVIDDGSSDIILEPEPSLNGIDLFYTKADSSFGLAESHDGYAVYTKELSDWDILILIDTDLHGILKIVYGIKYSDDEYGISAKLKYNLEKAILDDKFEEILEFDSCSGSDYVCGASNYSYSLYLEERRKVTLYQDKEDYITLKIEADGIFGTKVTLTYEAKEFTELF